MRGSAFLRTAGAGFTAAPLRLKLPPGRTTLQTWFHDESGKEIYNAYYVYAERKQPA